MTDMLAVRAGSATGGLTVERIPVPRPGPQDVLVRVAAAGLAPGITKLLAHGKFRHLPTTPGHEIAGTVTELGDEVDPALAGRRVRVHATLTCRSCRYCRTDREQMCAETGMIGHAAFGTGTLDLYRRYHDGGLAEYVRVPHWMLDPLPDSVSFDVAAKVHDFGNAMRALRCAELPLGATIVITAATGTMGTATARLARSFGVARLILVGRSAERLAAVGKLSGLPPVDTVALDDLGDWADSGALTRRILDLAPDGADAVLDYLPGGAGSGQAAAALATGGTLVHMGGNRETFPMSLGELMHGCKRVVGTRNCTRTDTDAVLDLLRTGALEAEDLITHHFSLTDIDTAIAALHNRSEPIWMAVVHP
ncbi:alcohol dehydrogenase/(R,R)-butanediol dehydrogenase/meso-butanediol dehydrogenase/diacetyl reductase [Nocardia tenerifensis]|uniref:Alcohol dehydrogenase/(R,R)-butanediol dehydrogenase/meso-butanediol dehydrogenase/diacetyl reductase n=1 Tax=Nocardia tenerifensis TaxID=228006 RepID=A0A318KB25_9NOCA|nr:alcohol dehydrogenase catalytic domain-containing protein [Nocardia tenerifensis]PXX71538.1 alcohol dehydrogenase/(R,R)-butanediol dehydrogenase/meso-butanediol dehydrogenase/diacetyl reductase [Nocardia tenerifensis]